MPFDIADAVFWIAVACCSVAQLAILRSAIVSPARTSASQAPSSPARRAIEITWALLPGIALGLLFIYTWSAMHHFRIVAAANALP